MTVGKLIELLEQYDENTEVRLMTQPHYPLQYNVQGVVNSHEVREAEWRKSIEDEVEESGVQGLTVEDILNDPDTMPLEEFLKEKEDIVYILEGGSPDETYGSKEYWIVQRGGEW